MELSLEKLYVDTGVLIKIDVSGMYEKSIQLSQQGAIREGFWGCASPEYFEISKP